jgi:hypothetical protein
MGVCRCGGRIGCYAKYAAFFAKRYPVNNEAWASGNAIKAWFARDLRLNHMHCCRRPYCAQHKREMSYVGSAIDHMLRTETARLQAGKQLLMGLEATGETRPGQSVGRLPERGLCK